MYPLMPFSSLAREASPQPRSTMRFVGWERARMAETMYGSGGDGHAAVCWRCESWYCGEKREVSVGRVGKGERGD